MNTDINNPSLNSINSENNIPIVQDVTETTPDTKSQEESISKNLEDNQEVIPMNSSVTPSTNMTQTTTTTPVTTTTEAQPFSTHQPSKTSIFRSDANTTTTLGQEVGTPLLESTIAPTLEQQEDQPEVALTKDPTLDQEVGQPVSEPASLPDKPKDTSKMRHRVSVRDEIYTKLKEESKRQGKPVVQLATEAISEYLEKIRKDESLTTTDETDF